MPINLGKPYKSVSLGQLMAGFVLDSATRGHARVLQPQLTEQFCRAYAPNEDPRHMSVWDGLLATGRLPDSGFHLGDHGICLLTNLCIGFHTVSYKICVRFITFIQVLIKLSYRTLQVHLGIHLHICGSSGLIRVSGKVLGCLPVASFRAGHCTARPFKQRCS